MPLRKQRLLLINELKFITIDLASKKVLYDVSNKYGALDDIDLSEEDNLITAVDNGRIFKINIETGETMLELSTNSKAKQILMLKNFSYVVINKQNNIYLIDKQLASSKEVF